MDAPVTLGGTGTSSAVAKGVDPRTTTFPPSLVAVLLCVVGVGLVGCWGVGGWWLVVCLVVGLCWLGSSVPSFVEVWLVWGGQSDLKEVWLVVLCGWVVLFLLPSSYVSVWATFGLILVMGFCIACLGVSGM